MARWYALDAFCISDMARWDSDEGLQSVVWWTSGRNTIVLKLAAGISPVSTTPARKLAPLSPILGLIEVLAVMFWA